MNKIILVASLFVCFAISNAHAQTSGIEFQLDGTGSNLAGQEVEINLYPGHPDLVAGGGTIDVHFLVTNNSGVDGLWRITRKEINVPTTWSDQLCWPPNCYPTTDGMYTTPSTQIPTILNGTSTAQTSLGNLEAELKPRITPDASAASFAHYRYYINEGGTYLDSVDLIVNYTLGLNSSKLLPEVSIQPNPATDYVNVVMNNMEAGTIKIIDVLGNLIFKESISGSKKIDLGEFRNGVYFLSIETPSGKIFSRKLIVRR